MTAGTGPALANAPSHPSSGPAAGPWRSTHFRLFFAARSVSLLGDGMLMVALTTAVLATGYGASGVGWTLAAWMGPTALLVLFGGVLADRFTPIRLMVGADLVRCGTQSTVAALLLTGRPALWEIMVLMAASGVATAFFQPGIAGVVPKLTSAVQQANAVLRISEALSTLLGPALAGTLVVFLGPGEVFAADAASYLASACCLFGLRGMRFDRPGRRDALWRSLGQGWQEFRSRRWLWSVIAVWAVYGLCVFGPAMPLSATLITQSHGSRGYGLVASAFGAGTILGGLLGLRLRPRRPLLLGGTAMYAFALYPAAPGLGWPLPAIMAAQAVAGTGFALWGVMWSTSLQTKIPPTALSRVSAYDIAGSITVIPIGRALAGPVADQVGESRMLVISSVLAVLAIAVLIAIPEVRNLTADRPGSTPAPDPEE